MNLRMMFSLTDLVCPHHREFASRFFDSSSDSEWHSDDSYYDYETDEDDSEMPSTPGAIDGPPLQGSFLQQALQHSHTSSVQKHATKLKHQPGQLLPPRSPPPGW